MSFDKTTECLEFIQRNAELSQHEEQLSRPQQAYEVATWLLYLDTVDDLLASNKDDAVVWHLRDFVGRRAVLVLPRSYKLWKTHWEFCLLAEKRQILDTAAVLACFERCLWTLSHFPRVWIEYLTFLKDRPGCISVTILRRIINRSLQSLPVTQHDKTWPVLLEWIHAPDEVDPETNLLPYWQIPLETRIRLLRRYCLLVPLYRSEFADFLVRHQRWGEAAVQYQALLNDGSAQTQRDDYWEAFSTLCTQHPIEVEKAGVAWEETVRAVLHEPASGKKDTIQTVSSTMLEGLLWTQLADSWIRRGSFDLARSVYEEGLQKVRTVRDFSVLYDAYLQFEEGLLQAVTDALEDADEEAEEEQEGNADNWDILVEGTTTSKLTDMELAMARAEHLTSRRPLLLNAVMLRQNPNNVEEWLRRSELYTKLDQSGQSTAVLEEALRTVQASQAVNGKPGQLVVQLGKLYEEKDLDQARELTQRICKKHTYQFLKADDLAECWAFWVEMELRQEKWEDALSLARQAVAQGSGKKRLNLTRSLRLWDLLFELEESLGTVQTTKDAYNGALEIKTATVQHVLNFASFLTQNKYFEESFTIYERGIEMFAFPHPGAKSLWKAYLAAFLDRYEGSKVERTRDLFERCLDSCPSEESPEFFLMNGEFEEQFGLTKRSLTVYKAMSRKVPPSEQLAAYQLFIAKTTKYLGITSTREIYQDAVDNLEDKATPKICIDFAKMETSLQEYERARAIFAYGAQMADPRRLPEYWKAWHEFEIDNGNEETFREMLRIKRSVEAAFSTVNYNAKGLNDKVENLTDEQAMQMIASREGVEVDGPGGKAHNFVPASKRAPAASLEEVEARVAKIRKIAGDEDASGTAEAEPVREDDDEIDLDEIDAEIEAAAAEGAASEDAKESVQNVSTKAVPAAVFGGLAAANRK